MIASLVLALPLVTTPPAREFRSFASTVPGAVARQDAKAVAVADRVMREMGGQAAWERTRYITWKFFGGRRHVWDKWTGDLRLEQENRIVLMNINTGAGRVFEQSNEVLDPAQRDARLKQAKEMWINDSYWMFMPYKLKDPGVKLAYKEKGALQDGRAADVIEMTFDKVGVTPENRYLVYVSEDKGLVEQWSFFVKAADQAPKFTLPWAGWKPFGEILLCTEHGQDKDWQIAVFKELPRSVFESPAPVVLPKE